MRRGGRAAALDRWDAAWLSAACALSLWATLPRLTDRPLWTDEALTVGASTQLAKVLRDTGGTMALYYVLVWPIAQITTDRFWLRLPSALFAAGAVAATYLVGRRIGGRFLAASAALLLASTWALARWGVEARGYALAVLLVSLSWLGLVAAASSVDGHGDGAEARERNGRRWWVLFVVAAVLAPLAHGLAALQFPVQVVALALRPDRRRWLRRLAPVAAVLVVEGVLLFAIGAGEVANWIKPLARDDLEKIFHMLLGRGSLGWPVAAILVEGTVAAVMRSFRAGADRSGVAGAWSPEQQAGWLEVVAVLWAWGVPVAVLAISLVRPYQQARYLVTSLPGIALVVALALGRLRNFGRSTGDSADIVRHGPPRRISRAASAVAVAVIMAVLLFMQPAATSTAGEDWTAVVERIAADGRPGDGLIIRPLLRAPFDYAYERLDRPVGLDPVVPTDAFGRPKRFYREGAIPSLRRALLDADQDVVWHVARGPGELRTAEDTGRSRVVASQYRTVQVDRFRGNLYLYRFERRAR